MEKFRTNEFKNIYQTAKAILSVKHHLNPSLIKTNANHLNEIALDFIKSDKKMVKVIKDFTHNFESQTFRTYLDKMSHLWIKLFDLYHKGRMFFGNKFYTVPKNELFSLIQDKF